MKVDIDYIKESGLIERYVLGQTSCHEAQLLEEAMAGDASIRKLIDEASMGVEILATSSSRTLPAGLEEKIMSGLSEKKLRVAHRIEVKPQVEKSGQHFRTAFGVAAAIAGVLLVGGIKMLGELNKADLSVAGLEEQVQNLESDKSEAESQLLAVQDQVDLINDKATIRVNLGPVAANGNQHANVYWNGEQQRILMDLRELPSPPDDKQYQLWAIVDTGPLSMGVLALDQSSDLLEAVPDFDNPAAFAITIEKLGGSITPSLDQMVVIGNVST